MIATIADALTINLLVGALFDALESKHAATKEAWHNRGAAFFRLTARASFCADAGDACGAAQNEAGAATDQGSSLADRRPSEGNEGT